MEDERMAGMDYKPVIYTNQFSDSRRHRLQDSNDGGISRDKVPGSLGTVLSRDDCRRCVHIPGDTVLRKACLSICDQRCTDRGMDVGSAALSRMCEQRAFFEGDALPRVKALQHR